jgi:hypothetical protein
MKKSRLVKKTAWKKRFSGRSRLAIRHAVAARHCRGSRRSRPGQPRSQATRAFVVDKQSGEVRLPTQAGSTIVQNLTTSVSVFGRHFSSRRRLNGAVGLDLDGGWRDRAREPEGGRHVRDALCLHSKGRGVPGIGGRQLGAVEVRLMTATSLG